MTSKTLNVVIVGGGIAGLSLGLMLQKCGINFVILESRSEIAPELGAGISLTFSSLRILDQLDCYDEILEKSEGTLDELRMNDVQGKLISRVIRMQTHMVQRYGYQTTMLDRHVLVNILYNRILRKENVFTGKKVASIETNDSGVVVLAADGSLFSGDMVIGADGVHSTVRNEMWRIIEDLGLETISHSEKARISCSHVTISGVSSMKIAKPNISSTSWRGDHAIFFWPGQKDWVWWGLRKKLPATLYGDDIPRFTEEEQEKLAREHWNNPIDTELVFGDIYSTRMRSKLVPLHTYILEKWHFGRIMLIGDAVHKMAPITGQGGQCAIETATILANALWKASRKSMSLSSKDVQAIFTEVHASQRPRADLLVRQSISAQSIQTTSSRLLRFLALHAIPFLGYERSLFDSVSFCLRSPCLGFLPVPARRRFLLWDDEVTKTHKSRGVLGYIGVLVCTGCVILSAIYIKENPIQLYLNKVSPLPATGNASTSFLSSTDTMDLDPTNSDHHGVQLVCPELFPSLVLAHMVVLLVDSYRVSGYWSLLTLPSLWVFATLFVDLHIIIPLYHLTRLYVTSNRYAYLPIARPIPLSAAKSIFLGMTLMSIVPLASIWNRSSIGTVFQCHNLFPLLVAPFLVFVLSYLPWGEDVSNKEGISYQDEDLPILKAIFVLMGLYLTSRHISDLLLYSHGPKLVLAFGAFSFLPEFIVCASTFVWVAIILWDLKNFMLVSFSMPLSLVTLLLAFICIGPGATMMGVCYLREQKMSFIEFQNQTPVLKKTL